ncbi:ATP-binding protein [Ideonella sp. BN130291]|uniref:ATP-binding protein n=1 Tax=Ideonella sp. BN130291 TaxID=3112940 RepID=UPI002E275F79|nr:ATP-binding protein [Ideonella sp. BN130291]
MLHQGNLPPRTAQRRALTALLALLACVALVGSVYGWSVRSGTRQLHRDAERRLAFLSNDLASALDKYDTLPAVLASHTELVATLRDASDAGQRQRVNELLERLAQETHVNAVYLMDAGGTTVAASNWRTPRSFVGQNYAFRPYFRQASEGGTGRFYAVGATTGEPGYFLARAVRQPLTAPPLGVVAVKISLDDIEANWARSGERLALLDAHGVVFLASRPSWKFHGMDPLPGEVLAVIRSAQQYGDRALQPLPLQPLASLGFEGLVQLAEGARPGPALLVHRQPVGRMDWTLVSFSDVGEVQHLARGYAIATAFGCGFVLLGLQHARLRRRGDEERRIARRALERADAQLEQRIGQRTAVLLEANHELARKLAEIDCTQRTLRATQDELVQAGKLAVLGQMAASITHEINQPLTALRALNDNAVVLLERGDQPAVRGNLQLVDALAQRIGGIVSQLKGFARKDDLRQEPVALAPVIDMAVALVAANVQQEGVRIERAAVDAALVVQGQAVRIEQVLVNLLRNAIDASRLTGDRHIELQVRSDGNMVSVAVADRGPGIAPDVRERLFEPFFTTKAAGQGLGLGLAISASIANALGGTLTAQDRPGGGTIFTLSMRAACVNSPEATQA